MQDARQHALVLAPHGRDAAITGALLGKLGIDSTACADLGELAVTLSDTTAFVVLAEEATRHDDLKGVAGWLAAQPSWSDLAFIVYANRGGGPETNPSAARLLEVLGNVTFIERPFHPATFSSVARTAYKARQRQFEARARMEELRRSEERLRHLNETLEARVAERTAALIQAHDMVLEEIAQRERTEELLRQTQKMEVIGQITGGVAHDFNNLLMAILANLELLRKHIPAESKARRLIDGAVQGGMRGAALTQRLLAFARRQNLEVQAMDLAELVRGMEDILVRAIGPGIEMKAQLAAGLPAALIDANQIELALLNLVVNARDAMPEGGLLTIRLDLAEPRGEDELPPGRYLRLSVKDTGRGMDAETLKRAIEPFFSTKELGKGTGLGLSMTHGLAKQLNGALQLESLPGKGTTATLWLPATAALPLGKEAPVTVAAGGKSARSTILVVDDDFLIAMATVDMLEDLGHDVIEANSGAGALETLKSHDDINLLITDYSMPGMTGLQLAKQARALRPELPILLATGYADLPDGADMELPRIGKPYQQHELAAEIAKLLQPSLAPSLN
jgi:signal transduction histidine kinase